MQVERLDEMRITSKDEAQIGALLDAAFNTGFGGAVILSATPSCSPDSSQRGCDRRSYGDFTAGDPYG